LQEGESSSRKNPVVAQAAPRLTLAIDAGKPDERRISCRRIATLLGRRQGCKIVTQDRRLAPAHVALVNDGTRIIGIDLVTSSGTLLNGLKLEHEIINDGDMLTCSPWEFRVDIETPEHAGDDDAHPFDLNPSPHVVALEHVETGRLLKPARDICTIGRLNGCDITIDEKSISRVHALLFCYFGQPAVFDLLTTNHTLVNNVPIQLQFLKNGDTITIGKTEFKALIMDSPVVERASVPATADEPTIELTSDDTNSDLIDIHETESSQRWRIADKLDDTARQG
jgi:pSer/pThr/pTyr-binding forkhead associated (FHA) protein